MTFKVTSGAQTLSKTVVFQLLNNNNNFETVDFKIMNYDS